jgi:cytoskeleton protein RodZ
VTENKSMGAYLRAARRRRRVSIERAAEDTKIRADFLMRMESDEFDFLAPAYVRGFIRTYARYLRVDPGPLLEDFERRFGGRVDTAQIIAQQRRQKTRRKGLREPRRINSWLLAAGFALGILIVLGIIGSTQDEPPGADNRITADRETPTPTPTPEESESPEATPTPEPTETPDDALAFDDGITLKIVARHGDCWIDVTTDGVNAFTGMMAAGDTRTFEATDDLSVLLGLPESVDLIVNGQNLGSPGGTDPITVHLPEDVASL